MRLTKISKKNLENFICAIYNKSKPSNVNLVRRVALFWDWYNKHLCMLSLYKENIKLHARSSSDVVTSCVILTYLNLNSNNSRYTYDTEILLTLNGCRFLHLKIMQICSWTLKKLMTILIRYWVRRILVTVALQIVLLHMCINCLINLWYPW